MSLAGAKVRKVRGPILDKLYAELKRCGDLSCTGKPFTEHRNVPALTIHPRDSRRAWQQVTGTRQAGAAAGGRRGSARSMWVINVARNGLSGAALQWLPVLGASGGKPLVEPDGLVSVGPPRSAQRYGQIDVGRAGVAQVRPA